ncbi:hypothetical protein THRCLA_00668 [Thraustotheca clavata]|uniref:Uncharacterized protein n=1 Tax=Thraustotheca clavata TaxID=74557 RepID=A0A1W0AAW4_9STRA|nr:hypothetical protein THRCLA_00668 [Thraustotheca clavata]
MNATQYINVFIDFIIAPCSIAVWAKSYMNTENIYQMDIDGQCLRYALDGPREVNQFDSDITKFEETGFTVWGGEIIHNYVHPTTENVALHEYVSQLQPYNKADDKAAIAMWRNKLFLNLSTCLERRAQLVNAAMMVLDYNKKHHCNFYEQPELQGLNQIEYAQIGNLTSWNNLFKQLIAVITNEPFEQRKALEELGLLGGGCFSSCKNASASGGMTLTIKRSGSCITSCFGLDSGSSNIQLTNLSTDGVRLPYSDYPTYLVDMLFAGTQASIVITKSNGSEAIILNFIALMSLTGYEYFFLGISIYLYKTAQWVHKKPRSLKKDQMLYSIVNCSISSVIWAHYRTSMTFIGFLGLIAYHIDVSRSSCHWDDSIFDIAQDSLHSCQVFYALVLMDRMPGIAIYMPGYIVAAILHGLVPFSVLAILVVKLQALSLIHNRLLLVLEWCVVITILRTPVSCSYVHLVEKFLTLIGARKQIIALKSPFRAMLGDHYSIESALIQKEDATYIPLSILMETSKIKLQNIHDHQYFVFGLDDVPAPREHPSWVSSHLEYYVCVHKE